MLQHTPEKEYKKARTSILKHFTRDPHSDLEQNAIKEWNVYKDAMLLENSRSEDYVIKRLRLTKASRGGGVGEGPNRCSCWLWPWPLGWLASWAG